MGISVASAPPHLRNICRDMFGSVLAYAPDPAYLPTVCIIVVLSKIPALSDAFHHLETTHAWAKQMSCHWQE